MKVELSEEERQVTVFALARLAIERPGWGWLIRSVANSLDPGLNIFNKFVRDVAVGAEEQPDGS
jgi:hypothetical protein